MKILFQNDQVVIVDKPANWLSVPSRFQNEDGRPVVGKWLEKELKSKIFPTHRLDFEVSGIIVFAKTAEAHRLLNQAFENRKIKKTYEALTTGELPEQKKFEWKAKVLRGKRRAYESPVGKPSLTLAECMGKEQAQEGKFLRWRLHPVTGRAHQLRFDLSRHGYPILGDELYGSKEKWKEGIALRAIEIHFEDEKSRKQCGLPEKLSVQGIESRL
ncbi:MAG: ribosomal large subunit pseudouridine synthase A [Oligoflexia bacterium]|nr:MAG: ribosomal large subunit pseudouridine synthase A [Oligoflexia bacterium]